LPFPLAQVGVEIDEARPEHLDRDAVRFGLFIEMVGRAPFGWVVVARDQKRREFRGQGEQEAWAAESAAIALASGRRGAMDSTVSIPSPTSRISASTGPKRTPVPSQVIQRAAWRADRRLGGPGRDRCDAGS